MKENEKATRKQRPGLHEAKKAYSVNKSVISISEGVFVKFSLIVL